VTIAVTFLAGPISASAGTYSLIDLGTLLDGNSYGSAINDAGQVMGRADTDGGAFHAFLYSGGVRADLALGGTYSYGLAINAAGQVTGQADTAGGASHAFLTAICGNSVVDPGEQCNDGNILDGDGCSATCTLEPCVAAPVPGCLDAAHAQLQSSEKTPGKERLKLQWKKVATATIQGAFGDPVTGTTRVALCLYDDAGTLIRGLVVDQGGQSCAGKPCWKAKGTKGYGYNDKATASDGISKIGYGAGDAGKGKADATGGNNIAKGQIALPTGIVAALSGNTHPTMQLVTSDRLCIGATMTEVTRDDGLQYKARKK
jgi:cysteine-rich repeat protein/probable HAF family extracellular repeat protein